MIIHGRVVFGDRVEDLTFGGLKAPMYTIQGSPDSSVDQGVDAEPAFGLRL
jgi:hypothetical protein